MRPRRHPTLQRRPGRSDPGPAMRPPPRAKRTPPCPVCSAPFLPGTATGTELGACDTYCGVRCRVIAARRDERQARGLPPIVADPTPLNATAICPQPLKASYPNEQTAAAFIAEVHSDEPALRPYRCPCGAIHIGNDRARR